METYAGDWHGSTESLTSHAFGQFVSVVVAEKSGRLEGFIAWTHSYDLHWSMPGAMIVDLFVRRGCRGRGTGLQLICSAASRVESDGGKFLKGGAVDGDAVRLEYTLSGRAFRHVSSLQGASARMLVTAMPEKQCNFEE